MLISDVYFIIRMKKFPVPFILSGGDRDHEWVPREPDLTKPPSLGQIYGVRPKYGLGKCGHHIRTKTDYVGEVFKGGSPIVTGSDIVNGGWIVECQKCHWSWTVTKDRVSRRARGVKCERCEK